MRSPVIRKLLAVFASTAVLTLTASAFADGSKGPGYTESKDQAGQVVKFTDDPLDGAGMKGTIPIIHIVGGGQRLQLMRPRVNFVSELTKSVENM